MRDFSYQMYTLLCSRLKKAGYKFQTFEDYLSTPKPRVIIIRHDVDVYAYSALRFAKLESKLGIPASYYFRTTKLTYIPKVFKEIVTLGHELGYHYEDLARRNGDLTAALTDFQENLSLFRKYYPVRTVCMHGSSGSPYDNRQMWESSKLSDFSLIGEPYISLDFSKIMYFSDTTQQWNRSDVALRDKVKSGFDLPFSSTLDIINNIHLLPDQVMFTMHPELWTGNLFDWLIIKALFKVHSMYKLYYRNHKIRRQQKENRGIS